MSVYSKPSQLFPYLCIKILRVSTCHDKKIHPSSEGRRGIPDEVSAPSVRLREKKFRCLELRVLGFRSRIRCADKYSYLEVVDHHQQPTPHGLFRKSDDVRQLKDDRYWCHAGLCLVAVGAFSGRHLRLEQVVVEGCSAVALPRHPPLVQAVEEDYSAVRLLRRLRLEQAVEEDCSAVRLLRHQHLEHQVRHTSSC